MSEQRVVLPHGGYKKLLSYQKAEIVFEATSRFCERFVSRRDRTYDQMVQAARQIARLDSEFLDRGGLRERMTRLRLERRRGNNG